MKRLLLGGWLAAALLASPAQAAIINGDFETGDLTGWTAETFPGVGTATATVIDVAGNHLAQVKATLPSSTIIPAGIGNDLPVARLSQTFFANAGQVFSADVAFSIQGYFVGTGPDVEAEEQGGVFAGLIGPNGFGVEVSALHPHVDTGFDSNLYQSSPTFSFALPYDGSYTFAAGANIGAASPAGTNAHDSYALLQLDNVTLVPEPPSWVLAFFGLLFLAAVRRMI